MKVMVELEDLQALNREVSDLRAGLRTVINNLGVPGGDTPTPIAVAYHAAVAVLDADHRPTVFDVAREMRNLRGPASEETVHEWAARLEGGDL